VGKLDRILALLEENNKLLKDMTCEPLETSYGRNAHVSEAAAFVSGGASMGELAVLEFPDDPHCRDDLNSYGDVG
jgi:hypothetical protein